MDDDASLKRWVQANLVDLKDSRLLTDLEQECATPQDSDKQSIVYTKTIWENANENWVKHSSVAAAREFALSELKRKGVKSVRVVLTD